MAAATSIPLLCNICPKKPTFSDVSHLLTHIASKGHLSHYYKVKVRAGSEQSSRKMIEAYDCWYADWNVEDLMSERMNLKEKKRSRTRASASGTHTKLSSAALHRGASHLRGTKRASNGIDLRPTSRRLKAEASESPHLLSSAENGAASRSQAPKIHFWTTSFPTPVSSVTPELDNRGQLPDVAFEPSFMSLLDNNGPTADADVAFDESQVSECTKLKGVFWPGMDIFDSATPEMRRKRNQKKDVSVVEQLEMTSLEVEPTELVFTPLGSLKKLRKISGLPDSDSSPMREPSPRKPAKGRAPLAEMDVNCPWRNQHYAYQGHFEPTRKLFDDLQSVDTRLPSGRPSKKRKRAFDIFQDEVSFAHPAPLTYLNSAFQVPSYLETLPHSFDFKPFPAETADTSPYGDLENAVDYDSVVHGMPHQPVCGDIPDGDFADVFDGFPSNLYDLGNNLESFGQEENNAGHFPHPYCFTDFKTDQGPIQEELRDDERTVTAPPSDL